MNVAFLLINHQHLFEHNEGKRQSRKLRAWSPFTTDAESKAEKALLELQKKDSHPSGGFPTCISQIWAPVPQIN